MLRKPLDRERTAGYTLTVTATDHGRPPKTDTTDIEIVVQDVNDNAPKFTKESYKTRVDEDISIGTSVLSVSAIDADFGVNGRVRYTFDLGGEEAAGVGGGGEEDFIVDPTLGIIRTAKELDRERRAEYVLRLFAVDRGSPELSTEVKVVITVGDVNDNAPQWETMNIAMHINENSPIGKSCSFWCGEARNIRPNIVTNILKSFVSFVRF